MKQKYKKVGLVTKNQKLGSPKMVHHVIIIAYCVLWVPFDQSKIFMPQVSKLRCL